MLPSAQKYTTALPIPPMESIKGGRATHLQRLRCGLVLDARQAWGRIPRNNRPRRRAKPWNLSPSSMKTDQP